MLIKKSLNIKKLKKIYIFILKNVPAIIILLTSTCNSNTDRCTYCKNIEYFNVLYPR